MLSFGQHNWSVEAGATILRRAALSVFTYNTFVFFTLNEACQIVKPSSIIAYCEEKQGEKMSHASIAALKVAQKCFEFHNFSSIIRLEES